MKSDGLICFNPWDPQSARIYGVGGGVSRDLRKR